MIYLAKDEQAINQQILETAVYCNDCGWNGQRKDLIWRTQVGKEEGLICPECESFNLELTQIYVVTGDVRDSIKYMAQIYWEKFGPSLTYKTIDKWIEETRR